MSQRNPTRTVFRLATALTLLAVLAGSIVCATESGMACPTWPGCHPGQLVPGFHLPQWIEFGHRLISGACLVLLVMAAISVWRSHRDDPWVRWLPWVAVAGAVAAAVFGMSIIFWGIGAWLGALDLLCSLVSLIAITIATVALEQGGFRWTWTPAASMGVAVVLVLMTLHALGILVAGEGSYTRCMGWPLLSLLSYDGHAWWQVVRLALAAGAVLTLVATAWASGWRDRLVWLALGAVAVELVVGVALLARGISPALAALYSFLAVAILWLTVCACASSGLVRSDTRRAGDEP